MWADRRTSYALNWSVSDWAETKQLHGLAVDGYIGPNTWRVLVPDAPGTDVDGNGVVDPAEISSS